MEEALAKLVVSIVTKHGIFALFNLVLMGFNLALMGAISYLWIYTNRRFEKLGAESKKDRDKCEEEMNKLRADHSEQMEKISQQHREERFEWIRSLDVIIRSGQESDAGMMEKIFQYWDKRR